MKGRDASRINNVANYWEKDTDSCTGDKKHKDCNKSTSLFVLTHLQVEKYTLLKD